MMFGVNFWSLCFTSVSLVLSGGGYESLVFVFNNADCMGHVLILSVCSATGQLLIFYTIKKFGPIVFTIMMTRQMLSLTVSCVVFGHKLGGGAVLATCVVFGVLFYRTKRKHDAAAARA